MLRSLLVILWFLVIFNSVAYVYIVCCVTFVTLEWFELLVFVFALFDCYWVVGLFGYLIWFRVLMFGGLCLDVCLCVRVFVSAFVYCL